DSVPREHEAVVFDRVIRTRLHWSAAPVVRQRARIQVKRKDTVEKCKEIGWSSPPMMDGGVPSAIVEAPRCIFLPDDETHAKSGCHGRSAAHMTARARFDGSDCLRAHPRYAFQLAHAHLAPNAQRLRPGCNAFATGQAPAVQDHSRGGHGALQI